MGGTRSWLVKCTNGNMTSDGVNSYVWDRANRLLSMGGISYTYNGDGNRIQQDALRYILDTQPGLAQVIGDSDGNRYIHSPRGIHASQSSTSTWSYIMQDGLGSVRSVADSDGSIVSTHNYTPIGVMDVPFEWAFTGEQRDSTGVQYHRARHLSPGLGVWLSLDPFEGTMQRPMSLNGYSWVEGQFPNATDASGLCVQTELCERLLGLAGIPEFVLRSLGCLPSLPTPTPMPAWPVTIQPNETIPLLTETYGICRGLGIEGDLDQNRACAVEVLENQRPLTWSQLAGMVLHVEGINLIEGSVIGPCYYWSYSNSEFRPDSGCNRVRDDYIYAAVQWLYNYCSGAGSRVPRGQCDEQGLVNYIGSLHAWYSTAWQYPERLGAKNRYSGLATETMLKFTSGTYQYDRCPCSWGNTTSVSGHNDVWLNDARSYGRMFEGDYLKVQYR